LPPSKINDVPDELKIVYPSRKYKIDIQYLPVPGHAYASKRVICQKLERTYA
jgi:hypothetical protein